MTIARIVAWVFAGGWRWIAGGVIAMAIGWLTWAIWDAGYQTAAQACGASAARARAEKAERERDAAGALAKSSQQTAAELAARDLSAQEQLRDLQSEIERLRAAVRPGLPALVGADRRDGRPRDDPLLDDACGLTDRGLRVLDGR
ncbi:hypothetical protein GJ689_23195 [Rhodoplanes serenus]|uniref:Uncharacterized protein n=1 Tax=Rhodoplanes serenus TaxID=200615 RepID=A0A9X4XSG1_9BRAD|nr:hypothetical protein [Rhodoplanes serenus]MTW19109.1 hypothetical protein [Rhodoplanes serenus]